ncbi:MAG: enoyl-CoA hydratase [Chloroflexi bacterium]|nr:enoyl-CoA hydratase [Chloroflexota bacterium]
MTPETPLSTPSILTETHGRVGLIRINRPDQLNALNSEVIRGIVEAAEAFDADPEIRCIVLAGDERAFAAGADIRELADATAIQQLTGDRLSLWRRFQAIRIPIIAAVSGWCLGGGNELAMMCDMIIASETARFGQPEVNLGIMPGAGGTQRLARAVGKAVAMEMALNGRFLSAQEALDYHLVNRVVPVEHYLDEAMKLAAQIAARAPLSVRLIKEAINQAFETPLSEGLMDERRMFYLLFSSEDQKEGMAAFLEKRKPRWKGR